MKNLKTHIIKRFTGGMSLILGMTFGLFIVFGITYAAVTISTTSVTPGTPMTASLWNAVKTDLDNLAAEFNDIGNFNNVTLTSVATDDVLAYDGSNWINQASATGGGGTGGAPGTIDWGDCETNSNTSAKFDTSVSCSTGYTIVGTFCYGNGRSTLGGCNFFSDSTIALTQDNDFPTSIASIKCCKLN